MSRPVASNSTKKARVRGLVVATLMALIGVVTTGTAAASPQSWSVFVHIEYPNGFVYEHAFATGVPTSDLPSILAECGSSHRYGSAVRYHCFPVRE